MNRRFLSIYFPNWSVNLQQRKLPAYTVHDGLLLVTQRGNQKSVSRMCSKARSVGIKEGMALSLAKVFLPNATVAPLDPLFDFKSLYRLAVWGHRFSPLNGLDPEIITLYKKKELSRIDPLFFGVNLDITGTERVHKGERLLLQRISKKIAGARFDARIAVAPTLGAAWALSRFSKRRICSVGRDELQEALSPLPIEACRVTQVAARGLRDVGITTIKKLLEMPRRSLAKRYGTHCLYRIDQVLGVTPEAVTRIPMPNHWALYREYEYPLADHGRIVAEVLDLLEELIKELAEAKRRGKYFLLLIQGEDLWGVAYRHTQEFSLLLASHNEKHIRLVVFPIIEKLQLPGPVLLLGVTTKDTEVLHTAQTDMSGSSSFVRETTEELINELAAQVGQKNVVQVHFSHSYLPEESFQYLSITQGTSLQAQSSNIRERPSKLLEKEEEIVALAALPDSPPKCITWNGIELRVLQGVGPERISMPWLESSDEEVSSREYFKIQDHTGRWLWIFRATHTHRWFVHGIWV